MEEEFNFGSFFLRHVRNCGARLVRRKSFMFEMCIRTDPHVTRSVFEELEHLCAMQEIPGGELWKVSFSQWLSFRQFLKANAHSRCHERSILVVTLVRLGFPGTASLKPPRILSLQQSILSNLVLVLRRPRLVLRASLSSPPRPPRIPPNSLRNSRRVWRGARSVKYGGFVGYANPKWTTGSRTTRAGRAYFTDR